MSGKRRIAANKSFSQLAELVKKAGVQLKSRETSSDPRDFKVDDKKTTALPTPERTDTEIFEEAMGDVVRASWRHYPHPYSKPGFRIEDDPDAENLRLMQSAMDQSSPITVLDHPEYIEGWIGVAGRRFLPKLRSGLYSIQGQIDLHGFNRTEAQIAVEDYIIRLSRDRPCCIKIIHGRGINSDADRATLKESLQRFLLTRRMSRYVVAYASAPYCDGGVGAVYVLLCRR